MALPRCSAEFRGTSDRWQSEAIAAAKEQEWAGDAVAFLPARANDHPNAGTACQWLPSFFGRVTIRLQIADITKSFLIYGKRSGAVAF